MGYVYFEPSVDQLDAEGYRIVRDAIDRVMTDPDAWDGDEAEPAILVRWIQHVATATHGDCTVCREPIKADEYYEDAGEGESRGRAHSRCL